MYVSRASVITERGSLYGDRVVGYETPAESGCNIDTMGDWAQAEALIARRGTDATPS